MEDLALYVSLDVVNISRKEILIFFFKNFENFTL